MKNPIVHFEIPADNVERAITFYKGTFGWNINKFEMADGNDYWIVQTTEVGEDMKPTSPGINGGLMQRKNPGQPFMNYISVESVEKACRAIAANGGTIIMPKQEIGKGMGWIAAFKDTEGNIMGLHEEAEKK
ncbi:MAG TPA: VOC family protein [Candidatus Nanoarchaeia archaeon]|nr:VOC family protein [Candidatus Nanoarchaeia archaeon]